MVFAGWSDAKCSLAPATQRSAGFEPDELQPLIHHYTKQPNVRGQHGEAESPIFSTHPLYPAKFNKFPARLLTRLKKMWYKVAYGRRLPYATHLFCNDLSLLQNKEEPGQNETDLC